MAAGTPDFVARAVHAFEEQLRAQVRRHGEPAIDPEIAGRRAAIMAMAGQAWAEEVGPFYDTDGARAALGGVSKQAVSQRVAAGRLLGLRLATDGTGRDRLVYPAWQFHPTVLRHLPTVLDACGHAPERAAAAWTVATWLTTADPRLDGMTPAQLLRADRVGPVLAVAREVAISLGADERHAAAATEARTG